MARILIADTEEKDSLIQNLLKPKHELVVVTTMSQAAIELKRQPFDLVIIDLHFDESRMFDAMHLVKSIPRNADTPIIGISSRISRIPRAIMDGMSFTARALGAWMFLDVHEYNQTQDPEAEVLRVIERCLVGEARRATHEARADVHKQRQDIHRLRLRIEQEEWSPELDRMLIEMRQKLTALLLQQCELHMVNMSQQEVIDESRDLKDRVAESVMADEDKSTRSERQQTLKELQQSVGEIQIAQREEEKKRRKKRDRRPDTATIDSSAANEPNSQ